MKKPRPEDRGFFYLMQVLPASGKKGPRSAKGYLLPWMLISVDNQYNIKGV